MFSEIFSGVGFLVQLPLDVTKSVVQLDERRRE